MKLKKLIKSLGRFHIDYPLRDFRVEGISCASDKVKENFIFCAIKGNDFDGHKFIPEAIKRKAKVIILENPRFKIKNLKDVAFIQVEDTRLALAKLAAYFYGHPSNRLKVVGITGTNGKTTISYLIEAILKEANFNSAVIGTINYRFKNKIIPAKNTTPSSLEIQYLLNKMLKKKIDYVIMEVSSHALDQKRTAEINFYVGIFTNLTQDHLDYHHNLENYFEAKAKLFRGLSKNSVAIINQDDPYGLRLKNLTKAKIITYGIEKKADIVAKDIKLDIDKTEFTLITKKEKIKLTTSLIGWHNVYNILAAVAFGLHEKIELKKIKSAIEKFKFVPGRLEKIDSKKGFWVFVDYAHTEDALKNVISALREITEGRIIVVFGCGGQRDRNKRPKMGSVVSKMADFFILTNDNPRSEDPKKIIEDIKKGIKKDNFCVILRRRLAIKKALSLARPKDIVLIAGKGHENYQIIGKRRIPFTDQEVVKECLQSMNY